MSKLDALLTAQSEQADRVTGLSHKRLQLPGAQPIVKYKSATTMYHRRRIKNQGMP